jgi:tetratricopeptide (TPR) repeat protein
MGNTNRPRRNLFDLVAAWLAGGEPTLPLSDETQTTPEEGAAAPTPLRAARRQFAQLFWIIGTIFALLQLVFSTLDLANRTVAAFLAWSRFLIPALFVILIATEIYYTVRPRRQVGRRAPLIALAVTVAIGTAWGGWTVYQAVRAPKAVTVLIADFVGRKATKGVDWGDRIYEEVTDQIERLDLGGRVEVQRVYEAFEDAEQARKLGNSRKATIVLWGWYDDLNVRPRFELLRTAKQFESGLGPPPKELTDFDLYLRSGPQEMAYIVAVVLGLIQYADGNYATADDLFTAALDNAPPDASLLGQEVPRFYRAAARYAGSEPTDKPMGAIIADLEEATQLRADFWQADWNLALAYSDYCTPTLTLDAALAEAEKVVQLKQDAADSYWLLGVVRERRGELPQARAAYEQAVALDPKHVESLEALGKVLDELGENAAAREAYGQALEIRQQSAGSRGGAQKNAASEDPVEALDSEGYAYLNAGQNDRAIETFTEVLRQRPDSAKYHRHLGNAYYWQGKAGMDKPSTGLDKAIAEYETARKLDPRDSLLLTVLGGAYQEAGRPDDALDAYRAAVMASPCDDEALFLLASQYNTVGRKADADAAFRKLVGLNPRRAAGWQWLAADAFLGEDYAAAAEAYRAASVLEPDSADLYFGLGSSLYGLKDYAGAEAAYRQAKTLAPDDAASLAGWGDSLAKLGRTGEAITAYERAVELAPNYLTWVSLGLLYEQAGQYAGAASAYGKAAEYKPGDPLAHASAGRMEQRIGRYGEAAASYELAVRYDPQNAGYWESLAVNYAALSRLDDSLRAAEQTLKLNPASAIAYLARANVYEQRGDRDKALADYRQALSLAGNNSGVAQLARAALQRLGE